MKILYAPSFRKSKLTDEEKKDCFAAIERFESSPFHPGLNYERLGSEPRQNHCSIRASRELRVILAVEPEFQHPETAVLAYRGHHDDAYAWARRQGYRTDPADAFDPHEINSGDTLADVLEGLETFSDWRLFLHPEQEQMVQIHYQGEARIRGAAGTGKTVVGLHRANFLGRYYKDEGGKVLFTTFSRSLTNDLKTQYGQIREAAANVEFLNIDRLARKVARKAGMNILHLDNKTLKSTFDKAYRQTIPGTSLANCAPDYLRDEIERVIKGRAASKAEYVDTGRFERLGRKRGFNRAERELCWRLRETWDELMRKVGAMHFADVIIFARDAAQRQRPEYRTVIIDEAQDMTLAGMQLARALVAGDPKNPVPPDGLLMIDDTAQRIYAGGYRIAWAGLNVKGRSFRLQNNYRNTKPIVEAAKAVRGDVLPVREDADDGAALHAAYERTTGGKPIFLKLSAQGEIPAIARRIRELTNAGGTEHEAIGVLTLKNRHANACASGLNQELDSSCALLWHLRKGPIGKGVRVGTFDRSKGMEFSTVFIPYLGASEFPKSPAPEYSQQDPVLVPGLEPQENLEENVETRQLALDRLYVAMTRARDELWLIADEDPCPEIQRALDAGYFEIRSA